MASAKGFAGQLDPEGKDGRAIGVRRGAARPIGLRPDQQAGTFTADEQGNVFFAPAGGMPGVGKGEAGPSTDKLQVDPREYGLTDEQVGNLMYGAVRQRQLGQGGGGPPAPGADDQGFQQFLRTLGPIPAGYTDPLGASFGPDAGFLLQAMKAYQGGQGLAQQGREFEAAQGLQREKLAQEKQLAELGAQTQKDVAQIQATAKSGDDRLNLERMKDQAVWAQAYQETGDPAAADAKVRQLVEARAKAEQGLRDSRDAQKQAGVVKGAPAVPEGVAAAPDPEQARLLAKSSPKVKKLLEALGGGGINVQKLMAGLRTTGGELNDAEWGEVAGKLGLDTATGQKISDELFDRMARQKIDELEGIRREGTSAVDLLGGLLGKGEGATLASPLGYVSQHKTRVAGPESPFARWMHGGPASRAQDVEEASALARLLLGHQRELNRQAGR